MLALRRALSLVITLIFLVTKLRAETCTTSGESVMCEVRNGEAFEIACRDVVPVHWEYPRQEYDTADYDDTTAGEYETSYSYTFPEESQVGQNLYKEEDGDVVYYNAKLNAEKVVYKDTGFYKCVREGEKALVKQAYYFVKDDEKLLVDDEGLSIFYGFLTKPLTIPCKPTSPDVTVSLKKESNEITVGTSSDGKRSVTYDPRIGFRISTAYVTDSGSYICEAVRGDKNLSAIYIVNIIDNLYK